MRHMFISLLMFCSCGDSEDLELAAPRITPTSFGPASQCGIDRDGMVEDGRWQIAVLPDGKFQVNVTWARGMFDIEGDVRASIELLRTDIPAPPSQVNVLLLGDEELRGSLVLLAPGARSLSIRVRVGGIETTADVDLVVATPMFSLVSAEEQATNDPDVVWQKLEAVIACADIGLGGQPVTFAALPKADFLPNPATSDSEGKATSWTLTSKSTPPKITATTGPYVAEVLPNR